MMEENEEEKKDPLPSSSSVRHFQPYPSFPENHPWGTSDEPIFDMHSIKTLNLVPVMLASS
jgi:hypothetical protein